MKTWVLGALMTFPALAALAACGGGGGAKCAGKVVDNVCVPSTTGTGGSGSTSSGTGGHASSTSSSGTATSSSSSSSSGSTSGGTGGSPSSSSSSSSSGATCSAPNSAFDCGTVCPDFYQCENCVFATDPAGTSSTLTILMADCACQPDTTCYADCQNEPSCTGQTGTDSDACSNCVFMLPDTDACMPAVMSDCEADPGCTTFRQELAPCQSLPL